jgi:hypothetical protein
MDLDLPQSLLKKEMGGSARAGSPNEFILGSLNERQVALLNQIFLEKDFFLSQKDWTTGVLKYQLTNIAFKANQVFNSLIKSYVKTLMASEESSSMKWKKYVVERALQIKIQLKGSSASAIFSEEGFSDEVDLDASIKLDECPPSTIEGRYVNRRKLVDFFNKVAEGAILNLLKKRFKGADLPFWDLFREKFILFSDNSTFLISFCGVDFSFSLPIFTGYKRGSTFLHESLTIYLPFREGKFCVNGDLEIPLSTEFSASSEKVKEAFEEKTIIIPQAERLTHNGLERLAYSISKGWSVDSDSAAGIEILIGDLKERKFSRIGGDLVKDELFKLICNKAKAPEEALAIYLNAVSLCRKEPKLLKEFDNYLKISEIVNRFPGRVKQYFLDKPAFDLILFLSIRSGLCLTALENGFDPMPRISKERVHGSDKIRFVNIGESGKSFVTLPNLDYENLTGLFHQFQANYPTNEIFSEIYEFSSVFEIEVELAINVFYFHRLMLTKELSDLEKIDLTKLFFSWIEIILVKEKLLKLDFIKESLRIFISEKSQFCFPDDHKPTINRLLDIKSNPRFIPLFFEYFYGEGTYFELLKETLKDPYVAKEVLDFLLKLEDDLFISKSIPIFEDIFSHHPVLKEEKNLELINFLKKTNALSFISSFDWIIFLEKNLEANFSLIETLFESSAVKIFLNPVLFSSISKNEKLMSFLLIFLAQKIDDFEWGSLLSQTMVLEGFASFFKDLIISHEPSKIDFAFKLFRLEGVMMSLIYHRDQILRLLLDLKAKDLFPFEMTKELISFFSQDPEEDAGFKFCLFGLNILDLSNLRDEEFFITFMNMHYERLLSLKLNQKQSETLSRLLQKCYQIELRKGEVFSKPLSWIFNTSVARLPLEDILQVPVNESNKNILIEQVKYLITDYPYPLTHAQFENLLALSQKNDVVTKKLSQHLVKIYHEESFYKAVFSKLKAPESLEFLKSYLSLSPSSELLQLAIMSWKKTRSNLPRISDTLQILETLKGKDASLEKLMFLEFLIQQIDPREEKILGLMILLWLEIKSVDKLSFLPFFSMKSPSLSYKQKISVLLSPISDDSSDDLMGYALANPQALHLLIFFFESFKAVEKRSDSTPFVSRLHDIAKGIINNLSEASEDKISEDLFWHFLTSYISYFCDLEFDPRILEVVNFILSRPTLSIPYVDKVFHFIESKMKHLDFPFVLGYINKMSLLIHEKRFTHKANLNKLLIEHGVIFLSKDLSCYPEYIAFVRGVLSDKKVNDKDYIRLYLSLLNLLKLNERVDLILDLLMEDPFILRNGSTYLEKHKNKLLGVFKFLIGNSEEKINLEGREISKEFKSWALDCALAADTEELFKDIWFAFIDPTYDFSDESKKIAFTNDFKKVLLKNTDYFQELVSIYEFRSVKDFKISVFVSHLVCTLASMIPSPQENLDLYHPIFSIQLGHYASSGLSIDDFILSFLNVINEFYFFSVKISKLNPLPQDYIKKFAISLVDATKSLENPNELCVFYKKLYFMLQSLNFRSFSEAIAVELLQDQHLIEKIMDSEIVEDLICVLRCFYSANNFFKTKHVTGPSLKVFFKKLLDTKMREVFTLDPNLDSAFRIMAFFITNKTTFSEKIALSDKGLMLEAIRYIIAALRKEMELKSFEEMDREKIQSLLLNLVILFDEDWISFYGFQIEFLQLIEVLHLLTKNLPFDEKPNLLLINWQIKSLGILMANSNLENLILRVKREDHDGSSAVSYASVIKRDINPKDFEAIKIFTSMNENLLKYHPLVLEKPHFDFVKNYLRLIVANSQKEFKYTFFPSAHLAELGRSLAFLDSYLYNDIGRVRIEDGSLFINRGGEERKLILGPGKTRMGSDLSESFADFTIILTLFLEKYEFEDAVFFEFIKKLIGVSKFVIELESPESYNTKYLTLCLRFLKSKNVSSFPLKKEDFFTFFNYIVSHLISKAASEADSRELVEIANHLYLNFFAKINFTAEELANEELINKGLSLWVNQSTAFFRMLRLSERDDYIKTSFNFFARLLMIYRPDNELFPLKYNMILSYLFIFAVNVQKTDNFMNFIQFHPWFKSFFMDDDNQVFAASFLQALINTQQPVRVYLDRLMAFHKIAKKRANESISNKFSKINEILQRLVSGGLSTSSEIPLTEDKFSDVFFEKLLLDFLLIIAACKARASDERLKLGKSVATIDVSLEEIHRFLLEMKEQITANPKYQEDFLMITEEHLEVLKKDKMARDLKNILRAIIVDLRALKAK